MASTAVWPAQGDDSHGNDVAQAHHQSYQSDHLHQQQHGVIESVRSYGSLSTGQTDHRGSDDDDDDGSSCCSTTASLGHGSAVMDKNERRKEQRKRQGDGRRYRHGSSNAGDKTPVPTAENIHFEGHLLHRICEVTGKFPGGGSTDNGSEGERSEESLLEDSGEHQLARLRRNPKVKEVISRLKSLSTSLIAMSGRGMASGSSTGDEGVEYAVRGSRANTLRLAQQEYLRLFEEMLAELLRLQREKAKAFRAEKLSLQRELARAHKSEAALKDEAGVHSIQLEALLAVKKALDTEVATQEAQLTSLSAEVESHARMENVTRREHFAAEHKKAEFLNEMKQEEQALRTRFKEVEVEATRSEMGVRSMEHLVAKVERAAAMNRHIYRVDET
ncbi:unnamed protein product [Ectocarpus sp. CCAP 1310/34]|nr:unnamed protein product [Ectocarpus sp. CCAP 1310/34]